MTSPELVMPQPGLDEAQELRRFWESQHDRLIGEYPEQFVAVRVGEVIASNSDLAMLVYALRDMGLDPRTDVWIEFITAKAGSLLL